MIPLVLPYIGAALIVLGAVILVIAGTPAEQKREIYKDYPFGRVGDIIVKPFRIQDKGKITCKLSNIVGASGFRIFLTDLFSNMDIDYTYGPRYFQTEKQGDQIIPKDLGRGEYALIIDSRNGRVDGKFSIEYEYRIYPRERLANWGLAIIEVGAAVLVLGLALLYQK